MSNQYLLNFIAGRDPNIRAGDADRERVAERLRKSHTEGRLDIEEFQQRLERCYQARTFGDLGELVRDLPRQEPPQSGRSLGSARWRLVPFVPILLLLLLVSAATSHHHDHDFWLWVPLLFIIWRVSAWRRRRSLAGTRRGPGDWI